MKRLFFATALLLIVLPATSARGADPALTERLTAAVLLTHGRLPTRDELARMPPLSAAALPDLVATQQALLNADARETQATLHRSAHDSFGRNPTGTELTLPADKSATYATSMADNLAWLSTHPADYRQVIDRAYQFTLSRPAFTEEYTYWEKRKPLPYVLLVGAIENWAQRNAPGLMVTTGAPTVSINSRYLRTFRLSPGVANEVRGILGLPVWSDVGRLQNPGCNIVALGAEDISSLGGIHFMVIGRPDSGGD